MARVQRRSEQRPIGDEVGEEFGTLNCSRGWAGKMGFATNKVSPGVGVNEAVHLTATNGK